MPQNGLVSLGSETEVDYKAHQSSWDSQEDTAVGDHNESATLLSKQKQNNPAFHSSEDWNYVRRTLAKEKPLPPITWRNVHKNINWISFLALTVVPVLACYGAATTPLRWQTALWAVIYYFYTGLGITAGYHRLWAHRAYNASIPLQYFLMFGGSGAVEGSIRWWSRGHRGALIHTSY